MNCTEFDAALEAAADNRRQLDDEACRIHAVNCPRCALEWQQQRVLLGAVDIWRHQLPAVDLAERVLAGLAEEPEATIAEWEQSPALPRSRGWVRIVSTVAVVLLLGLIGLIWQTMGNSVPDRPLQADLPSVPRPQETIPATPDERSPLDHPEVAVVPPGSVPPAAETELDDLFRSARSAYSGLAEETVGTVRDVALLVPVRSNSAAATPADAERWVPDVTPEWPPLGNGVGQALDFFLGTAPIDPAT